MAKRSKPCGFGKMQKNMSFDEGAATTMNDTQRKINDISDDADVTFTQLAEMLGDGVKANTIAARWFPVKVSPAYATLDCPSLRNGVKLSGFGAKAIAEWYYSVYVGGMAQDAYEKTVAERYAKPATVEPEAIRPEIMGNELDVHDEDYSPSGYIELKRQELAESPDIRLALMARAAAIFHEKQQLQEKIQRLDQLSGPKRAFFEEFQRLTDEAERKLQEDKARAMAQEEFARIQAGKFE